MTANFELGSAFSRRYLIALTPLLNSFEGMEPEASMMKTTSYMSSLSSTVLSTEAEETTTPTPVGFGLRRKGSFLAGLLAISSFDGLPV